MFETPNSKRLATVFLALDGSFQINISNGRPDFVFHHTTPPFQPVIKYNNSVDVRGRKYVFAPTQVEH